MKNLIYLFVFKITSTLFQETKKIIRFFTMTLDRKFKITFIEEFVIALIDIEVIFEKKN